MFACVLACASKIISIKDYTDSHPECYYDDKFADEMSSIFNQTQNTNFVWPPYQADDDNVPTAAPLYIAPPETQHIKTKPIETKPDFIQKNVIDEIPVSWTQQQQTRSAPALTQHNLNEHNVLHGNYFENYTSTCTTATTATTSDDYQRTYQAHAGVAQKQHYDHCSIDYNANYDHEVSSYNNQLGSFSSASTDLMSFSGRRSVQECSESVFNAVNTSQLVNYLKDLCTPIDESMSTNTKAYNNIASDIVEPIYRNTSISIEPKREEIKPSTERKQETLELREPALELKIEEHKTTIIDITKEGVRQISVNNNLNAVPKEWTSLMCRALTTAPDKPYKIPDITESAIEECNKAICSDNCREQCPNVDICYKKSEVQLAEPIECKTVCSDGDSVQKKCPKLAFPEIPEFCAEDCECLEINVDATNATQNNITSFSNFISTAQSDRTFKGSYMTAALTVASPTPLDFSPKKEVTDDVALPEESAAYVPPPISMKPFKRIQNIGTKSPFLQALTTAPIKSYTPFENDVITQLIDLPTPTEKGNLLDALTVAPEKPILEFNPELPSETEDEKIIRLESERLAEQATEVNKIISNTVQAELNKNISAFAPLKGFRSVHPFRPNSSQSQIDAFSSSHQSENITEINNNQIDCIQCESQNLACLNESNYNSIKKTVVFPPPSGTPAKAYVQSGLQSPKTIPKYQRQWFNLPTQSPIKTPEPPELKENVPLAFAEVPHETNETVSKPIAVTISVNEIDSTELLNTVSRKSSVNTTITEVREAPAIAPPSSLNLQTFEPVAHRPPTPTSLHRSNMLPHYQQQQKLVCEQFPATRGHIFEPNIRSPSPCVERARSPAPGPPPNPLKIHSPKVRSPDLFDQSNLIAPSIVTGQSGLNIYNSTASAQVTTSAFQTTNYASQKINVNCGSVQSNQINTTNFASRSQQSQYNETKRCDVESSSNIQIGNTQVQRNRKVAEEFERIQTAKTEITQTSGNDAAAVLISASFQKSAQLDESEPSDSYSKGFVARQARRLSENPICRPKIIECPTTFPQCPSPNLSDGFPLKENKPINEPPKEATYHLVKPKSIPKLGVAPIPLPGYQQVLPLAGSNITSPFNNTTNDSCLPIKLTKNSVKVLPTNAFALPASITSPTISNAFTCNNTITASKPISVSEPGSKLTNTNHQSVVSDPSPASAGPNKGSSIGATSTPKRGRGVLNNSVAPGARVPQCGSCYTQIR